MEEYFQATSDSLPKVDLEMIMEFLQRNSTPEVQGAKTARAAKADYGDKAIGYVDLRREGTLCFVRAKVTPEHKVRLSPYSVTVSLNEDEETVISALCHDCAASAGGCKHAVAFLFWLHRRSEEPSPTETVCYWKKPVLSAVKNIKAAPAERFLGEKSNIFPVPKGNLLEQARSTFPSHKKNMMTLNWRDLTSLPEGVSINFLIVKFKKEEDTRSANRFLSFAQHNMEGQMCADAEEATRDQAKCSLWHELRFGRITASSIYECTRHVQGDSLIDKILGAGKPISTAAIERGKALEPRVIEHLSSVLNVPLVKCGLFLSPEYPFLGASPDALSEDFAVEVKCPFKKETRKNYIKDGVIQKKYYSQIQLQMYFSNKKKGLFAVADPEFNNNKKIDTIWVDYDEEYVKNLISEAKRFWISDIYPELICMY